MSLTVRVHDSIQSAYVRTYIDDIVIHSKYYLSLPPQTTPYNYTSDEKYALVEVSCVALSERVLCMLCIHMHVHIRADSTYILNIVVNE